MAKKRNGRQDAIRDIVRNKDVRTQRVLVDELRAMGFDCTQATVSRDIADMGLRKLPEGIYVLAEDLHLQRMVSELVTGVLRTDNLVMIKAQPGTASGIAAAVDAAELPDVLGSLAGNDTILVIAQTAEDGELQLRVTLGFMPFWMAVASVKALKVEPTGRLAVAWFTWFSSAL